jgi:hypothetical protein
VPPVVVLRQDREHARCGHVPHAPRNVLARPPDSPGAKLSTMMRGRANRNPPPHWNVPQQWRRVSSSLAPGHRRSRQIQPPSKRVDPVVPPRPPGVAVLRFGEWGLISAGKGACLKPEAEKRARLQPHHQAPIVGFVPVFESPNGRASAAQPPSRTATSRPVSPRGRSERMGHCSRYAARKLQMPRLCPAPGPRHRNNNDAQSPSRIISMALSRVTIAGLFLRHMRGLSRNASATPPRWGRRGPIAICTTMPLKFRAHPAGRRANPATGSA